MSKRQTTDTSLELDVDSVSIQPISGTVTANAGTNLNTSALALESGGNLETLTAKDFATQTTLVEIATDTDSLVTAQGASSLSVTGPLVQSQVNLIAPNYVDSTIQPLSMDTYGNLRVVTFSDAIKSAFDERPDDGWNQVVTPMGFALNNFFTIDNAWES